MERLEPGRTSVVFQSRSGPLAAERAGGGYVMDFPAQPCNPIDSPNYLAVLSSAAEVRELRPDIAAITRLGRDGVIVTAQGEAPYDFTRFEQYTATEPGALET
jgi:hypothetical protein